MDWRNVPAAKPCCTRSAACAPCLRNAHAECFECHGCGCLKSAQHAAHVHGVKLKPST